MNKVLTLLITLIITLASSNVFAKTFICDNWVWNYTSLHSKEKQGTLFVGEKDGDNFIIKDIYKKKITLTYLGKDSNFAFYSSGNKNNINIYSISIESAMKNSLDGTKELGRYDFKIAHFWGWGVMHHTFCNWQ